MTKINKDFMTPEEKNNMYEIGYRYMVEGDYRIVGEIDTWTGMPNVTNNIYVFTDKDEAEAGTEAQSEPESAPETETETEMTITLFIFMFKRYQKRRLVKRRRFLKLEEAN